MINALRHKLEHVYGMPVKSGNQCHDLSDFIYRETGEMISFQTLRRFFGFIKTNSDPSFNTLNIISKVCGFQHYQDFCDQENAKSKAPNLIEQVFSISLRKEHDLNYHLVCRNIAQYLYNDLEEVNKNIRFLSNSKTAHLFFFERFPFIDHINHPIYKRALELFKKKADNLPAIVFVDSLIYLGEYLKTGKVSRLPNTISLNNYVKLHPFLQARVLGSYLLSGVKKDDILKRIRKLSEKEYQEYKRNQSFPTFTYMIADYLILLKLYEAAFDIMSVFFKARIVKPSGWLETGYYETFELLYCMALQGLGEDTKAKKEFQQIDIQHIHFIFHKYYGIRYLQVKGALYGKLSKAEDDSLKKWTAETKFNQLVK